MVERKNRPGERDPRRMTAAELAATVGTAERSPVKAIRAFCRDCAGGSAPAVLRCGQTACPLWSFRMGSTPYRKPRKLSPAQKAAHAEQLAAARGRRW